MKKLSLFLGLILCVSAVLALPAPPVAPTPVQPGIIEFAWTASISDTNPADPLNYVLEQGTSPGVYTSSTNVGTNLSCTVSNLGPGTNYTWTVVAVDTNTSLVSSYSNPVNWQAPLQPKAPLNLFKNVIQQ